MARTRKPVERKVYAAASGAGVGAAVAAFAIWFTGVCWGGSTAADQADATAALVPTPVAGLELLLIPPAVALASGYLARSKAIGEVGAGELKLVILIACGVLLAVVVFMLVRDYGDDDNHEGKKGQDWERHPVAAIEGVQR